MRFKCGAYKFGATDTKKINFCLNEKSATLPRTTQKPSVSQKPITSLADLENYKINNVVVQMGDDGTNDEISLEVSVLTNHAKIKTLVHALCEICGTEIAIIYCSFTF